MLCDIQLVEETLSTCRDALMLQQLCYILARQVKNALFILYIFLHFHPQWVDLDLLENIGYSFQNTR